MSKTISYNCTVTIRRMHTDQMRATFQLFYGVNSFVYLYFRRFIRWTLCVWRYILTVWMALVICFIWKILSKKGLGLIF